MRPTMVDLVSDPPRLLFPDGITVSVPRSVARREALRIVRAGLPPEPAGGGRVAAQPDPHVLLATRVTDVTPPAPVAGENADGGAAVATSDRPSVRTFECPRGHDTTNWDGTRCSTCGWEQWMGDNW